MQSRGYGWGDLKTDPKHMKIMNNEEQRGGGWLVIECSPGRKHKNMHIKGFSPLAQPSLAQTWPQRRKSPPFSESSRMLHGTGTDWLH